jgi:hypothetical protein
MQFLLIISHDESFVPSETLIEETIAWVGKMAKRGIRKYGNPLRPAGDAKTVRVREGKMLLTDGPFAACREQMCAYDLIDCSSLEEALGVASQHPMATAATIEVRPIWLDLCVKHDFAVSTYGMRQSAPARFPGPSVWLLRTNSSILAR